ncbi:hypothetical protein ASPACDRAFT_63275 [Aspergillus aculeatus ATCC 16872]|uniref:Enoyl reductase (ER) domain-containing protein n=1 Tax=Aspergillus aculeatus (strain ATCC 16872 / CBS 172.66 / WB 5094) TaxID=690307 RepID=A0A1L9WLC2_ASPA1|nr:uncharacterized protein ASPACDRAFT_63275 [Aspergillus aculeatus ATCC 16872]OJJ96963.1 hypothetical protein ASPACDRAFT_63275 [Aspergillus aculeatus ATCC 16872]
MQFFWRIVLMLYSARNSRPANSLIAESYSLTGFSLATASSCDIPPAAARCCACRRRLRLPCRRRSPSWRRPHSPTAGLLALYALRTLGCISTDDSVLVRHAANGVGQLAIQLAQLMSAKLIVTEDSQKKRETLRAEYNLSPEFILSERQSGVEIVNEIRQAVSDRGVDLVLNFDRQELEGSPDALAPFGTLVSLELSNNRPSDHPRLLRDAASRCITLAAVDLTKLHGQKPAILQQRLWQLSQLMLDGSVVPVTPLEVLAASELAKILQAVQKSQITGKVG